MQASRGEQPAQERTRERSKLKGVCKQACNIIGASTRRNMSKISKRGSGQFAEGVPSPWRGSKVACTFSGGGSNLQSWGGRQIGPAMPKPHPESSAPPTH